MGIRELRHAPGLGRALLTLVCFVAAGCELRAPEPPPELLVEGDAAHVVSVDAVRATRSFGAVMQWQMTMTRRSPSPIGRLQYVLRDAAGGVLSSGALTYKSAMDYRGELRPGDAVTLSIPAERGLGGDGIHPSPVRQITLIVTSPPDELSPSDGTVPGGTGGSAARERAAAAATASRR